MFSRRKSDEIRLFLPYWHTNKKIAGSVFFTVEGNFRSIEVELAKVASGCWIKPFKAHLKCRHVFSRFKSLVWEYQLRGGFVSSNTPPRPQHRTFTNLYLVRFGALDPHTNDKHAQSYVHPKKRMTIEIPVVVVFVCCLAKSSLENEAHQAFLH